MAFGAHTAVFLAALLRVLSHPSSAEQKGNSTAHEFVRSRK